MSLYAVKPRQSHAQPSMSRRNGQTSRQSAQQLTPDQAAEIREAFELFDTDKDGFIDYHQLKVAMRALGFDLKKAEVVKLLKENDQTGDALMDYDSFLRISGSNLGLRDAELTSE